MNFELHANYTLINDIEVNDDGNTPFNDRCFLVATVSAVVVKIGEVSLSSTS
jgi:hypothetical protein